MRRIITALILLASFLASALARPVAEEPGDSGLAASFPATVSVFLEIPSVDGTIAAIGSTALGKLLSVTEMADLFRNSQGGLRPLAELVGKFSLSHKWGMAVGVDPTMGVVGMVRVADGSAEDFLKVLLALDPDTATEVKPIPGVTGIWGLGEARILVRGSDIFFAGTETALALFTGPRDKNVPMSILLRDMGAKTPGSSGFLLYWDFTRSSLKDFLDHWEYSCADLLGLTSAGTMLWTTSIDMGRAKDKICLKPKVGGWKGLLSVIANGTPKQFSERIGKDSLAAFRMSCRPSDAFAQAVSMLSEERRLTVEKAIAGFDGGTLAGSLDSAYSGNIEGAVHIPRLNVIPHAALSLETRDVEKARLAFDFVNAKVLPAFPLSTIAGGLEIHYRSPMTSLSLSPCCALMSDALLFADTPAYLRSLARTPAGAFSPAGGYLSEAAKPLPVGSCAGFFIDNRVALRYALSVLPLASTLGIQLPFDPALLPSAEEVEGFFGATYGSIGVSNEAAEIEISGDYPVILVFVAAWLASILVNE